MRAFLLLSLLLACGFATAPSLAHDSPEHVVEALTALMVKTGPNADLLYRRAIEYRALRKYAEAEADFEASLALDRDSFATTIALAEIVATQKEWSRALELVEPLTTSPEHYLRAAGLSLRGRIRAAQGDWKTALADFEAAMKHDDMIENHLLRAKAHAELGESLKQIARLREGWLMTDSPVLLRAWCDALIDAQGEHLVEASDIVEQELADSRYRSAWLLRRARIRFIQNNRLAAGDDLLTAIAELDARLVTPRPDPSLQRERAAASLALEEPEKAQLHLGAAGGEPLRLFQPDPESMAPQGPTRVEP